VKSTQRRGLGMRVTRCGREDGESARSYDLSA
jgi:hypothetical protein